MTAGDILYAAYDPNQAAAVERMFAKTFSDSEGVSEGELIGKLVHDLLGDMDEGNVRCFVAAAADRIIGSILFTRITFEREIEAFILAPVAVHTDWQGRGVGRTLIRFGLDALANEGVELAITYGDPAYYTRVGFHPVATEQIPSPLPLKFPHGWQAQSLTSSPLPTLPGPSSCVKPLNNPAYW